MPLVAQGGRGQAGSPPGLPRRPGTTRIARWAYGRRDAVAGVEGLQEPLQAEGEADAPVVAVAAQDARQAVVTTAAADLEGAFGRRREQLEDHLRIEADPPAEAEVELDPRPGRSRRRPGSRPAPAARRPTPGPGPRSRGRGGRGRRRAGPSVPARARTWLADAVEDAQERAAEVPLPPQPADDLAAVAPAVDDRDEGAEEAIDPAASWSSSGPRGGHPGGRRTRASRPGRRGRPPGRETSPPSAAAAPRVSTRAARAGPGRPERRSISRIRPTCPSRSVDLSMPASASVSRPAR